MKTIELKTDDSSVEVVLSILENLKDGLIREISIKKNSKNESDLEEFRLPNNETIEAMQDVLEGKNMQKVSMEELIEQAKSRVVK